jgi:hypothetical protein
MSASELSNAVRKYLDYFDPVDGYDGNVELQKLSEALAAYESDLTCGYCGNHAVTDGHHPACPQAAALAPAPAPDIRQKVCDEILSIMRVYREQEQSMYGVGTPGGLEHMGDVWKLFAKWEASLAAGTEREQ